MMFWGYVVGYKCMVWAACVFYRVQLGAGVACWCESGSLWGFRAGGWKGRAAKEKSLEIIRAI